MFATTSTSARKEAIRLCVASAVALTLVLLTAACGDSGNSGTRLVGEVTAAEPSSTTVESQTVAASTGSPPSRSPAVSPTVTYAEAESAYNAKRYLEATEMFAVVASRRPENAWGHYMHGLSAWKAGDNSRAEKALALALEGDSKHIKAHLNLARVLLDEGRAVEALPHVETAISLDSGSVDGYRLMGRVRSELKEVEGALSAYRTAIKLNDKDSWSMNNMGLVLMQGGRFEEALGPLARATEINTGVSVFWNNLGMSLERTGRFTQASEAYKLAVSLDGHAKAAASLARIGGRTDDSFVGTVDLKELARVFAASVGGWN
jgi:predicted Zn-dependent protease